MARIAILPNPVKMKFVKQYCVKKPKFHLTFSCENCVETHNFHIKKLGEITVFYEVKVLNKFLLSVRKILTFITEQIFYFRWQDKICQGATYRSNILSKQSSV